MLGILCCLCSFPISPTRHLVPVPETKDQRYYRMPRIAFVALGLCLLSHLEHTRNIRPSWILNVYLLVSLALDGARARTLWAIPDNKTVAIAFIFAIVIKSILLALEAKEKRDTLLPEYRDLSPEATCGVFNTWFFWWLNPLFLKGFKRPLTIDQLFRADDAFIPDGGELDLLGACRKCEKY